jgi:hypothetical protein
LPKVAQFLAQACWVLEPHSHLACLINVESIPFLLPFLQSRGLLHLIHRTKPTNREIVGFRSPRPGRFVLSSRVLLHQIMGIIWPPLLTPVLLIRCHSSLSRYETKMAGCLEAVRSPAACLPAR